MRKVVFGFLLAASVLAGCQGVQKSPPAPAAEPPPVPVAPPATMDDAIAAEKTKDWPAAEAALEELSTSQDPEIRRRSLAMLGLLEQNLGNLTAARKALEAAVPSYPEVASVLQFHLLEVEEAQLDYPSAIATAQLMVSSDPASPGAISATIHLPLLIASAGDNEHFAAAFDAMMQEPIDTLTEEQFVRCAEGLARLNNVESAEKIRIRLLSKYPQGRFTETVYGQLVADPAGLSALFAGGYQPLVDMAEHFGRHNRYDQALDLLDRLEARYPDAGNDPTFRLVRVSSLFNSRHYSMVIETRPAPDAPYVNAIELMRARSFWRTGHPDDFLAISKRIIARSPDSAEARETRLLLANYYSSDQIDYRRAEQYLQQVINSGSNGDQGEHIWTLGWICTVAHDDNQALATLNRYLTDYPDADYTTNSLFWSGKICDRDGRTAQRDALFHQLIDRYPYSYYSYRARQILGLTVDPPSEVPGGEPFPADVLNTAAASDPRLAAVDELRSIGLDADAARELETIAASATQDKALTFRLADLYAKAGAPLKADSLIQRGFRSIIRHGGTGIPHRFWEILYPLDHWDDIQAAGTRSNVDPYLVTAIIRQESAFEPTTVSNAGAVGLMQIMPLEATAIATKGGLPPVSRADLFDPKRNIEVGAAEIRQKIDAMNGNQLLGIAAYNAGEEAVNRWAAATQASDIDLFVESIPFAETRLYVKTVSRNLYEYRRIYGTAP